MTSPIVPILQALIPLLQALLDHLLEERSPERDQAGVAESAASEQTEILGTPSTSASIAYPDLPLPDDDGECIHCHRKRRSDADVCTHHLKREERLARGLPLKSPKKPRRG